MKTAVALLIFNRPQCTMKVFEAIRQAQPPILLAIADGPRKDVLDDEAKCLETRAIIDKVDWSCQVLTNYSEVNLGCKVRVSTGLDWVFQHVEEAIILEDDCLPDRTFFRYCEELLFKYRNDTRIMAISGDNFQFGNRRTDDSYYFSQFVHIWGWATWRRAWQYYDVDMKLWEEINSGNWLQDILKERDLVEEWRGIFQRTFENKINSWAYRWTFACWLQNGLTILPNINLVSNIGFDIDATHTKFATKLTNIPSQSLSFPLKHPAFVIRDSMSDLRSVSIQKSGSLKSKVKRLARLLIEN